MSDTYTQLHIHLVFAVKFRQSLIAEAFSDELEKYICGIIKSCNNKPLAIYCMPDHAHILVGLNPVTTISNLVRDIKSRSSQWINARNFTNHSFKWQEGFGAFSYAHSALSSVITYIHNQPEYHSQHSFREEYLQLLEIYKIRFKAEYLFEWI